jgi:hypothetical protein
MDKYHNILFEIKKQLKYIINDNYLIFTSNYFICLNKIYAVLQNALLKIEKIYYKYILYPKLCNL